MIHKNTRRLLLLAAIFFCCTTAKGKTQTIGSVDPDCPPDTRIPSGSFDTSTWTYRNEAAGIEFRLPGGWHFSTEADENNTLEVGETMSDNPFAGKYILLEEIAYDWGEYNYMLEAVLPYFQLKGNVEEDTEEPPVIQFGISYLPTGDLKDELPTFKRWLDKETERINEDIDRIEKQNNNPDLYPPYIFEVEVKDDFPVGSEEWMCVQIKSNGGEDVPLRNILHAIKKVGCHNVVIRVTYFNDAQKELLYDMLKNNIKNIPADEK